MINKFIRFSVVAILLLTFTPAQSQPESAEGYSVHHFTDEDGLPQNSINDLLFDGNGYLWLASQVGLVRFNGSAFQLYYPDDKPVMESNIVRLGSNGNGLLYFQTLDHHLYCYSDNNSRSGSRVNSLSTRQPWLLNSRKQVFDFSRFLNDPLTRAEVIRRSAIFQDLLSDSGNFFVADTASVYMTHRDSLYYYDGSLHLLSPTEGREAQCFVLDHRLYVLHRDSLSAVYDRAEKIMGNTRIEGDLHGHSYRLFSSGQVNHLLVDNRLYRLFPGSNGHIGSRFLVNLDFIPNISSIEYNTGLDLLLISTFTEGFYLLRRNNFRVQAWPATMQEQLSRHRFGPMTLHKGKDILTDKFIFTPEGAFTPVKGRAAIWQRCLYIDRNDEVWGARNSTPQKLTAGMEPLAGLPPLDANIVDYSEDPEHHLYCLTERSLWRRDSGHFKRLFVPDVKDQQQQNESMAFVAQHRLWIAMTNGLIEYDPQNGQARSIPELSGSHVRTIHVCRDSSVLIGTYGAGYYYYRQGKFFRMPLDKNGFLVTAHCFLEDPKGFIWIPCNKGLFKVPKADMDDWCRDGKDQLYYYYYGRQDGLKTNEFNGGFNSCGVITPGGFVSLLSMKGMVCFYTDSLDTDFPKGAIVMAHLEIDGDPAPGSDTITLPVSYNSLMLEVSCPYLGNRNNLYLQYNLAGLNDDWKEVPADGVLNLSRLAAGHYRLRVRKVNGFGKNNYQYRQWSLIVPPHFYRTNWFYLLVALVVLGLLTGLIQLRIKLVEKKKRLQESELALLRTNRQREKLISLVIHDLRSPLRFLSMLAGDLHDNQGSFSPGELKDRTYWVKKGAQDVYHFSEDFLLWVSSQKDNFKATKQFFLVRPLLQEIYDFFLEQALQKGNRLSYSADPGLQVWSDPHLMITIIRNLTDNSNKYTSQGEIRIEARQEGVHLLVLVADTGRGMNAEQAAAFLGDGSLDNMKSGSQLGHKFIVDLTRRINGTLSIDSGELRGTTVTLRVPMEASTPGGETA